MRFLFLLLAVIMFSVFNVQAQETKQETKKEIKQKRIVIIEKDDDGKTIKKEIVTEGDDAIEINIKDFNVDSLIQTLISEMDGEKKEKKHRIMVIGDDGSEKVYGKSSEKDMEVRVDATSGKKKIVIKTIENGEEKVMEWEGEEGDEIPTEFQIEMDGEKKEKKHRIMFIGDDGNQQILRGSSDDNIEVTVDDESGNKKIIIKTIEDGEEKIIEWEGDEGDEMPAEFEVVVDESWVDKEELPIPTVSMGIAIKENVQIDAVLEGSAAEEAGLQAGDIIKKLDSQIIYSMRGLLEHLTSYKVGDSVNVQYERDGNLLDTKLTLKGRG